MLANSFTNKTIKDLFKVKPLVMQNVKIRYLNLKRLLIVEFCKESVLSWRSVKSGTNGLINVFQQRC